MKMQYNNTTNKVIVFITLLATCLILFIEGNALMSPIVSDSVPGQNGDVTQENFLKNQMNSFLPFPKCTEKRQIRDYFYK